MNSIESCQVPTHSGWRADANRQAAFSADRYLLSL